MGEIFERSWTPFPCEDETEDKKRILDNKRNDCVFAYPNCRAVSTIRFAAASQPKALLLRAR